MKPLNRTKIRWLIPLFMALVLLRPFNGMAQDDSNFSWLQLIPPGYWLDGWSFEDTNWDSDFGFSPLSFTNIEQVPDWDGNALQVDATNAAWLTYNIVEDAPGYGEYTNLTLDTGSIEFWFIANWESADTNFYGTGPGDWGRFIDIGTWTTNADCGWWSLYLNPSGTGIYFSSGTNGVRTNYLNAPISWDWNTWHLIVLTYSPTNTFLYLDGQLAASGAGVCYVPGGDILTNGFAIGSDFATGMQQAHGQFDDLYTFNYQLSADDVSNDYAEISPELPGTFHPMDGSPLVPDAGSGSGGGGSGGGNPLPNYGTNLWIQQFGISSNNFVGILSNTLADVEYQMLFVNSLGAQWMPVPDGVVVGSEATNWTRWSVSFEPTTNFFLTALSYQDDSGTGIPDWWWLKYFGQDTIVDAFADPIGDGYTLYQDYVNGWSPTNWMTPAAPQGLEINSFNSASGAASLSWLPSPGPVTGYTLQTPDGNVNISSNVTSYIDDESSVGATYSVEADYASGNSAWSDSVSVDGDPPPIATIVPGPQGNLYFIGSGLPSDLSEVRIYRNSWSSDSLTWLPEANNYVALYAYATDPLPDGFFEIPSTDITSGICQIPSSDVTPFFSYLFEIQIVRSNGVSSDFTQCGISGAGYSLPALASVPFVDARRHLKDNLQFLLRAADDSQPLVFLLSDGQTTNHVCADFYGSTYVGSPAADPLEPLEDNTFFRNFIFDAGNMTNDGLAIPNTGIFYNDYGALTFSTSELPNPSVEYYFGIDNFVAETNFVVPASVLNSNNTVYLTPPTSLGVAYFGANFPYNGDQNVYGLPFVQAECAWYSNSILKTQIIYPAQEETLPGWPYLDAQQPILQVTNYYFCAPLFDEMPEAIDFVATNSTPLIIVPVGGQMLWNELNAGNTPTQLAGYARAAVLNGNAGVYGYLGQYFANAYEIDTNGNVTANTTGFLSPYGQFFATEPGPVAIVTMPDIDTGEQGTGVVYCVSMNVDKNHDGTMDTSYSGPDTTSQASPMEFWVNNGCDTNTGYGGLDIDLPVPAAPPNYTLGEITCPRDLENFARLWICGMPSLPTNGNYQVTLSWYYQGMSGSPAINLYNSVETNGGTGYLTDTNIAAEQCMSTPHANEPYGSVYYTGPSTAIASITPGSAYTFPATNFMNSENQYFLFEGAGIGEGELMLTVYENGNAVAQSGVWLDLHNIKDYYERAVITNNMSGAISNWTSSIETVQQATSSVLGTDTNLIVMVHGINVEYWDWLDDSETVLKRLYWAGYDGKFMTVKWPCNFFNIDTLLTLNTTVFNDSEIKSYKASGALKTYLTQLRSRYPGYQLNIFAHSQGNAVVGEAIAQGAPYDTYILTQGAMPDSCYDAGAPLDDDLVSYDSTLGPTPESRPMGYADIYTVTNFTGRIVNFYNTNDPVLKVWVTDQELAKPNAATTPYTYSGTTGYYHVGFPDEYIVTDPEESRAEISRSRTLPIGQSGPETGHGVIQSGWDLNLHYGFNDSFPADHSAQWTWPIQTTLPYYQEILTKIETPP